MTARVPDRSLEIGPDGLHLYRGEPFTGIGYRLSADAVRSEMSYHDGWRDGPTREWHPSGRIRAERQFRRNHQHGPTLEFDQDGHILLDECYECGVLLRRRVRRAGGSTLVQEYALDPDSAEGKRLERQRRDCDWLTG